MQGQATMEKEHCDAESFHIPIPSSDRYMLALLVTAIVSEIPWQLLGNEGYHKVVFTLLLGLVVIFLIDHIHDALWLMQMETALFSAIATMLNTDYTWHGICLMVVFYLFRKHRGLTLLFGFPLMMEYGIVGSTVGLAIPLMYSGRRGFVKVQWMKYLFLPRDNFFRKLLNRLI